MRLQELTELLLSVEPEVSTNDNELACKSDPEERQRHGTPTEPIGKVPFGCIGEDRARTDAIGRGCSCNHHTDRTNDLCERQSRTNMQS